MTNPSRLTARDLIAKSFSAKARRGYDPAEVDAYLMDVARQVDELNMEIDRLTNENVRLSFSAPGAAVAEAPAPAPAPVVAPVAVAAMADAVADEPTRPSIDAEDESLKLILRAAQQTAEQTIADAKVRADEIVGEARFRAAEIARESDRKAFEAASRTQSELARLEDELASRQQRLDEVDKNMEVHRMGVRELAASLLRAVGEAPASSPAPADEAAPKTLAEVAPSGEAPATLVPPPPAPHHGRDVLLDLTETPSGVGSTNNNHVD
jgi:DivIVA domain-containing protein